VDKFADAPRAKQKLVRLREAAHDAHVAVIVAGERLAEARRTKENLAERLREISDPRWHVPATPNPDRFLDHTLGRPGSDFGSSTSLPIKPTIDKNEIERVKVEIEEADAEIRRLADAVAERQGSWSSLANTVQSVDDWLSGLPAGTRITDHAGAAVKLRKGADAGTELATVRDRIAHLHADAHEVRSAPLPLAEIRALIASHVAGLAEAGRPTVHYLIDGALPTWPMTQHLAMAKDAVSYEMPDLAGALAWLFREQLTARLIDDVQSLMSDEDEAHALAPAERARRSREIADEILAAERIEESFVEMTNASRRLDADPRAILGIDGPAKQE
jgi:hypothetical protein